MNLTPSQQAAVDHRGSNLLVSASAGSGKTEVLARRCVALIADARQPCPAERLLVVTFTRAAAAELRVRVARLLRERAGQTRDPELRAHLRRQEVLVDAADISTIDAWCGRIVRLHSADADVDGEFTMLSEEDARLLRGQVLDELFTWIYSANDALAEKARRWLKRNSKPDDGFLRQLIARLNQFRENLVEVERWLKLQRELQGAGEEALQVDARQVLAAALAAECAFQSAQLAPLLDAGSDSALADGLREYRGKLDGWNRRLSGTATDEELLSVVDEIAGLRLKKPAGLSAAGQGLFDEVHKRWLGSRLQKRWAQQQVESALETAGTAAELTSTLLDLEQRYHESLSAAKRAQASYEFGDVLRMALDLLGTPSAGGPRAPTPVARRLQQRYEHVLVDEYQDTSPVQVEILRLVTRDGPGQSNRFMVGDVKQSIYGFRQAEPRLFTDLVQAFDARRQEGTVQFLSDNFRSHPGLLDGLNRLFATLFDQELGGTAFSEQERLRAGRAEIANPSLDGAPRIDVHLVEQPARRPARTDQDEEAVPLERMEREALLASELIRDMLGTGMHVPDRDKSDKLILRPLRPADIVILLRSARQNAAVVARALRKAQIPCLTSGRDALFDVPEVTDVRNALTLLVNRRQDVPLAAYLRSPMVGLSVAELLTVRAASPHGDFLQAITRFCGGPDDDSTVATVRAALEQLERWGLVAREHELPELLRRMFHDTGLLLFAQALPGGPHRVALLRALENFAAEFARAGQHGVGEFIAYLDDLATAELDPGLPVAAGENAVRIMTVHAAKGLEFPVVFLLNAGAKFNQRRASEPLQCSERGGMGLQFFDYPTRRGLVSARHHTLKFAGLTRDLEEELRLLYVATTRARERLLVVGHTAEGYWEQVRARYAAAAGPPPLASRLGAANALEWVAQGAAACELHRSAAGTPALARVTTHDADGIVEPDNDGAGTPTPAPAELQPADEAWVQRGLALVETPPDTSLAQLPAVISVSAFKELAGRAGAGDVPPALDAGPAVLRVPRFAEAARPDGRAVGTACHRFMEFADLRRIASESAIRQQVEDLTAAGLLSPDDAALVPVADVAWFAGTPTGRLLRDHADVARREAPLVYALPVDQTGEYAIVRGVLDCLVETRDGLVIIDYKTDHPTDAAVWQRRVAGYAVQLQLYARAAGDVFSRPVSQALLVLLQARRIVEVAGELPPITQLLAVAGAG